MSVRWMILVSNIAIHDAAAACKQDIKDAVKTLLGQKIGKERTWHILSARQVSENTAKMERKVLHFVSPASPRFIRLLCDRGLTIAPRRTTPPTPQKIPPTPYRTPVHLNDTAYFHSVT